MRKAIIFALAFLLLLPLVKADTYLTDCTVLDTPGETYYLTQDIINYTSGDVCMDVRASNITIDCQGHTISTSMETPSYGGIFYNPVEGGGLVVRNCVLTGWFFGVYLNRVSNNVLQNLVISTNGTYGLGVGLEHTSFNTLTNVTIFNTITGLGISDSDYTDVFNSTIKNNFADVFYENHERYCHSYFENVIGTDDKPIVFFNSTVEIRGWDNNASEIILCGADNSIVDNLKFSPSSYGRRYFVVQSNNVTISNSNFSNTYVRSDYSNNVTIFNSNFNNALARSDHSNNVTIFNSNFNNRGIGFYYSNNGTVYNVSISSSDLFGIYLFNSNFNTISNSRIQNCTYGISLRNSANNLIYNNLFNNTNNFYFDGTVYPNYWNTTRQTGTRVYSFGNEIGGNYWTNPDGNGYSDTCTDADRDGFCDDPYVLATDNVDYLALSDEYSPPTTTTLPPVHGVPLLSSTLVGVVIGFGIITFMLRTLFDIREPKKIIEYFIVLAVIVLTVLSLIALFG
jgi:parallel beta-helix repeat protein